MLILWIITGCFIGFMGVEVIASITKTQWPVLLNLMASFVGGFLAYNWAIGVF